MVKLCRKTVGLSDLWVNSYEKYSDFYASSWQRGDSPVPLLVIRLALAMASLAILLYSLWGGTSPKFLIYLTNWGLILITASTLSGLFVSIVAVARSDYSESGPVPWYIGMYWFLNTVTLPVALMITLLYWTLLYTPEMYESGEVKFMLDLSTHGFNSCIVFVDLVTSRTPLRLLHFYQPLAMAVWYVAFSGIYYAAGGTDPQGNPFVYAVLDWRQPQSTGLLAAGSCVAIVVLYVLLWGFALGRDKISTSLVRTRGHDLPNTPQSDLHRIV